MVWRAASDPYSDPQETEPAPAAAPLVTPVTSRPPPPPGMPAAVVPVAVPPESPEPPFEERGAPSIGPSSADGVPVFPFLPPERPPFVPRSPVLSRRATAPRQRVRGVVRHIDPWSVFRLSLLFYLCVLLVLLVAGIVLWNIASVFGVLHNFEKFIRQLFDLQSFKLHPLVALEAFALGGVVLVLLGTAVNVIATCLYNLISDVAGGVRVTILDESEPGRPA